MLVSRYGQNPPEKADVIVALGGDGFMLEALHDYMRLKTPIFGMHRGTVGFLMNAYEEGDIIERLKRTTQVTLYPLHMTAITADGKTHSAIAVNEVSMLRQTRQAAKIRIFVDGRERMPELACDGVLVATPAGSSAYNLSVHGPVLPIGSNILALTPISAFRPRRWRGALLPHQAKVTFEVLEPEKRPVSAVADSLEVRRISRVDVHERRDVALTMLFDAGRSFEERVLSEQFAS